MAIMLCPQCRSSKIRGFAERRSALYQCINCNHVFRWDEARYGKPTSSANDRLALPDAPEPVKLKMGTQVFHAPQPDMDGDVRYIWLRGLASHLWTACGWKVALKRRGISWQQFLEDMSFISFKAWIRGDKDWTQVVSDLTQFICR